MMQEYDRTLEQHDKSPLWTPFSASCCRKSVGIRDIMPHEAIHAPWIGTPLGQLLGRVFLLLHMWCQISRLFTQDMGLLFMCRNLLLRLSLHSGNVSLYSSCFFPWDLFYYQQTREIVWGKISVS